MSIKSVLLFLIATAPSAFAQGSGTANVHFEVASVRPSPVPPTHFAFTIDQHGVDFGNISMETIVETAYGLESWQIRGLPWFQDARFDIRAQAPSGATREQVPMMLRALLAERFGLKSHIESKESVVYALVAGKEGPKMKVAAENPEKPDFGSRQVLQRIASSSGQQFILREPGRITFETAKITMGELAHFLMFYVDDPVMDMTGLQESYEVTLEVPGGTNYKKRATTVASPSSAQSAPADPGGEVSVVASIRKLGLILDRRKAPVPTLVIDSMNRIPEEN